MSGPDTGCPGRITGMKLKPGSYWVKSGAYSLTERISLQVFRFGSFFLLVRAFSREEFGIWTLYTTLVAVYEFVRAGMVQQALLRFLSGNSDPADIAALNTASLVLHAGLTLAGAGLIWGLSYFALALWGAAPLGDMLALYLICNLLLLPFYQCNFIQQAHMQFAGIFFSNLARQGLLFGYILWGYFAGDGVFDLLELVRVQIVAAALSSLIAWGFARPYLAFSRHLSWSWLQRLLAYGKYTIGTSAGSMLLKSMDQILLGILSAPAAVAGYGTAMRITHLVEVPTQSMGAIVFPQSARRMQSDGIGAAKHLYEKSVGVILALILPGLAFIFLFPEFVLRFVAGERYLDMVPVLRITLLTGLLLPFTRQFGVMLDSIGKPRLHFFILMGGVLFYLPALWLLIGLHGTAGAAYATVLTYGLLFIANHIVLYRELGVQPQRILGYLRDIYANGFRLLWQRLLALSRLGN